MAVGWLLPGLIASFFYSMGGIAEKLIIRHHVHHPIAFLLFEFPFAAALVLLFMFFIPLSGVLMPAVLLSVLAGFLIPAGAVFLFKAMAVEEISRVLPLLNLIPVFTLMFAFFFLGETLGQGQFFGFLLILVGSFGVTYRKGIRFSPALLLAIAFAFLFGLSEALTKAALNIAGFWQVFLLMSMGSLVGAIPLARKQHIRLALNAYAKPRWVMFGAVAMALPFLGNLFWVSAAAQGPVSLVSALIGFSAVWTLLVSTSIGHRFPTLLEERISAMPLKLAAILLMLAGLYFIA